MNIPEDIIEKLNRALPLLKSFGNTGHNTVYVHSVTINKTFIELMVDAHDPYDFYGTPGTGFLKLTFNQFQHILDELNSIRWFGGDCG